MGAPISRGFLTVSAERIANVLGWNHGLAAHTEQIWGAHGAPGHAGRALANRFVPGVSWYEIRPACSPFIDAAPTTPICRSEREAHNTRIRSLAGGILPCRLSEVLGIVRIVSRGSPSCSRAWLRDADRVSQRHHRTHRRGQRLGSDCAGAFQLAAGQLERLLEGDTARVASPAEDGSSWFRGRRPRQLSPKSQFGHPRARWRASA